jgi:hypothetical protein
MEYLPELSFPIHRSASFTSNVKVGEQYPIPVLQVSCLKPTHDRATMTLMSTVEHEEMVRELRAEVEMKQMRLRAHAAGGQERTLPHTHLAVNRLISYV